MMSFRGGQQDQMSYNKSVKNTLYGSLWEYHGHTVEPEAFRCLFKLNILLVVSNEFISHSKALNVEQTHSSHIIIGSWS